MPLPALETKEFADVVGNIASDSRSELEATSQSLQEIALLINQTTAEVDRLSQRELQLANRVREMDANLESYPRTDIRDVFRAAHDVELRLMMMRSQLEQLQEREESIRGYQERLRTVVELAEAHARLEAQRQGVTDPRTRALRRGPTSVLTNVPLGEVIQAQEDERLRLAQRVVDGPAQILANVILEAEICERVLERDPEQAAAELAELRRVATKALVDSRRMLYELRPVVLRELGVVPTLRRYAAEVSRQRQLEVNIIGSESDGKLPEILRVALYRLLQESFSAAVADDNVTRVDIDLRYEDAQIVARLEARGESLDRNQTIARFRADEVVRHRLEQLGAELQAEQVSSTAIMLTLVIPLA